MAWASLIYEVSTQLRNIFQERRCVHCHIPFHPHDHTRTMHAHSSDQHFSKYKEPPQQKNSPETNNLEINNLDPDTLKTNTQIILSQLIDDAIQYIQNNLCPDCAKEIVIRDKGFCPLCGELFTDSQMSPVLCAKCIQSKPEWDNFLFLGTYQDALRELLLNAKFHNSNTSLRFLGKLLAYFWLIHLHYQSVEDNSPIKYPDYIIPMPLHTKRLKHRGYNQCIELSKFFTQELHTLFSKLQITQIKIPLDCHSLIKTRFTTPQSILSAKERIKNLKDTFLSKDMKEKHVLLIDDIATTNSTLKEASLALRNAGVSRIDVMVLAKSPLFQGR